MPNNSPPDMFADPAGWEDALVRRLTSKMAHDADVDEEQIQGAIDGTEKEIFNEATGADTITATALGSSPRASMASHCRIRNNLFVPFKATRPSMAILAIGRLNTWTHRSCGPSSSARTRCLPGRVRT